MTERVFKRQRGFLTIAQNGEHDYLRMAYGLALSLRNTQKKVPYLSVMVTPGQEIPPHYREVFDEIIDIPWGDGAEGESWKLSNEWKAYHATPYRETVKLDADMIFTRDISEWWNTFADYPFVMTSRVMTYRGEEIHNDIFRKCLTANKLPDVYSALMYFRWCDEAADVFSEFENVTFSWQYYWEKFLEPMTRPGYFSTDIALAIALRLTDHEHDYVLPRTASPSFIHMKSALQNWDFRPLSENWQDHISSNVGNTGAKIGRFVPPLPIHYCEKTFLTDEILDALEVK